MNIYFDNAASTVVRDEAIETMLCVMREKYGNPSSLHYAGRRAFGELEKARGSIADALGTCPENVYFTSGGTEANNWAIFGATGKLSRKGRHIITSSIEHSAVMDPIKELERNGCGVTYLQPDSTGCITAETFSAALRDDTVFASIMLVNNETGAINPVEEYAREIKRRGTGTLLHTDAVQGLCKIPFTVKSLGADLITVSSHKLHGPKGAGALYIKEGVKLDPLIIGGGSHERGQRAGTEALPAIAGFGEAVRLGRCELEETSAAVRELRELLVDRLRTELPDTVFIGDGSPFILSISLPGHKSEVLMTYLSGEGICVSKSAACKKGARSRTLEAMRLSNKIIDGALRVSFSRYNTREEAERFVQVLKEASESIFKAL